MNHSLTHSALFRPSLFWDVNISELSFEKNKDFIIRRVFDRGTWDEILDIVLYYGEDNVQNSILKAPSLRKATVYLASTILEQFSTICFVLGKQKILLCLT